jgi:hypothetical protein
MVRHDGLHPEAAHVDQWLWGGYRETESVRGSMRRRRAQMAHVLDCRERILGLMPPEVTAEALDERAGQLALVQYGTARWLSLLKQVRFRHRERVARRVFAPERCGDAPFRDADHGTVHVVSVLDGGPGFKDVEPFLCARASRRARAGAYLRHLQARRLGAGDLWSPHEHALVGQWGLFARTAISAGTCLGVYGGQLLDEVDIFLLQDDRYLMSASDAVGQVAVNGENMMSLMNTLFDVDGEGRLLGHPAAGYNVAGEAYHLTLRHGWTARVHAFRASEDIPAGRELRWNYDLTNA